MHVLCRPIGIFPFRNFIRLKRQAPRRGQGKKETPAHPDFARSGVVSFTSPSVFFQGSLGKARVCGHVPVDCIRSYRGGRDGGMEARRRGGVGWCFSAEKRRGGGSGAVVRERIQQGAAKKVCGTLRVDIRLKPRPVGRSGKVGKHPCKSVAGARESAASRPGMPTTNNRTWRPGKNSREVPGSSAG